MKIHFKTIFSVILFMITCSAIAETPPEGPYFGQTPPGLTPEVFAPGHISLLNSIDHSICFSKDGGECYFTVANTGWTDYRIYETHYEGGGWTAPAQASFSNNLSMNPCLADNDQSMYFTRSADAWKATRSGGGWSSPVIVGAPVSSSYNDWSCHVSNLGNAFLCTFRPGPVGTGGCDLWKVQYEDGNFTTAASLSINTTSNDCQPVPGPNEEYIIFSASRPGGYGGFDLYISFADGLGGWTAPQNLGPTINTSGGDVSPYISPDHKYLFFSRPVSSTDTDIYWVDIHALFSPYDFSCDGKVDFEDLEILSAYWLTDEPSIDIAPPGAPDGIINFREFALLAENWMYTPPDLVPPAVPTGLAATAGDSTVSLDWDDNSEPDFDGYNVYRSETFGSGYTKLNGSLLTNSSYTDNNVINETVYFYAITAVDTSANESVYSNKVSAIPLGAGSIIIQEDTNVAPGFCGVDGGIYTTYAGYTGPGFCRTPLAVGNGIDWSISVPSDGTYTFVWRYSLLSGNRTARLLINSSEVAASISFPATGAWTNWSQVSQPVSLLTGTNNIRLESITASGLAAIDYIMVTGDSPAPTSCP
jgi:hypothetical protein